MKNRPQQVKKRFQQHDGRMGISTVTLGELVFGAEHSQQVERDLADIEAMVARRGKQRAIVAVGHSLLVTGYYLITRQQTYQDLGSNYFDEHDRENVKRRAVKRLEQLGFQVQLTPALVA
ncbi:MAG: hypothetical protein R6W88_17075 [Desulfobacterales bacterium]